MVNPWTYLLMLGVICQDSPYIESATVSAAKDQTRFLGETNVDISCEFTIGTGETANILRVQRRRPTDSSFSDIVSFNIPGNFSVHVDTTLRDRADLILLSDSGTLKLWQYQCNDAASYKCVFSYVLNQSPAEVEDTMILSIQAEPEGKPSFISGNPNGQVFIEYQELNTRCEADVGLPAGNLVWFGYKDGQGPVDLTSKAIQGQPTQISSGSRYCDFRRESTLKLNLTREYNSFIFRCAVNHSTHQAPTPDSSCNDTPCFQSQMIEVQYPVRQSDLAISSNPSGSEFITGSAVTLKCTVDGNPPATYGWYKEDDRTESISQSGQLVLRNLGLDDTGLYSCYGSNTVGGSVYNVSRSINLSIVLTTTSTTKSTTVASRTSTSERVTPISGESTDYNKYIGPLIGTNIVWLLITTALVSFIFYWRRKMSAKDNQSHEDTRDSTTHTGRPPSIYQPSGPYSSLHSDPQHYREMYSVIEKGNEVDNSPYENTNVGVELQGKE